RERDQVAAVETHTGDRNARSLEPGSERDDFARGRLGVVGVDEQDEIFRPRVREVLERLRLVVVDLDIGVRHRAEDRDAEALVGQYGGGAGPAGAGAWARAPQAPPAATRAAR